MQNTRTVTLVYLALEVPYLKYPQRRLYSTWKIVDIYLPRFAEYWNASLRELEIFLSGHSQYFHTHVCRCLQRGPRMSADINADIFEDICGHLCGCLCGRPHGWVRTSADVRMDGCGCLRKSAWMGADVCRAKGSVRVAPPAV